MAVADLAEYLRLSKVRPNQVTLIKPALTVVAGRLFSSWLTAGGHLGAGVAPTTAAVPARDIAGALGQQNAGSGALRCLNAEYSSNTTPHLVLCDRLSHQGGLSGIVAGAQTTNLPTAALTRYTDGVGVCMALEIYTQIGTTVTSVSVTYTNEAGTGGRVSPLILFGGTGYREASRFVPIPLQSGDFGVRSVQSVSVTATTHTAGAFGVTLYKPLLPLYVPVDGQQATFDALLGGGMMCPEILDDACLFFTISAVSNSVAYGAMLSFVET